MGSLLPRSFAGQVLDGTSTYLIRDVAEVIERDEQYKFDKIIYVVGCA